MLVLSVSVVLLRMMSNLCKYSGSRLDMHVITDADWAGDVLTRRSTTGNAVFAAGRPTCVGVSIAGDNRDV